MAKQPALSGREVLSALTKAGYVQVRVQGSHHLVRKGTEPAVTIPIHGNKSLKRGTLRGIIKKTGMTPEEFYKLL